MADKDEIDYDALEARLTDPDVPSAPPARVLTGEAAAAYGHEFLLREYGSEDAIATVLRPGRPPVGASKGGASPVVRGVISHDEYEAFRRLERASGMKQSELVRKAVHDLLVSEKLVS
jgi:hypothetical protein